MRLISIWAVSAMVVVSILIPEVVYPKPATNDAEEKPATQAEEKTAPSVQREQTLTNTNPEISTDESIKASTETKFDVEAATQAFIAKMDPEKRKRADMYYEGGYWLKIFNYLIGAFICLILLFSKLSVKMRNLATRITRFKPVQTFLYWIQYLLIVTVVTIPMTLYEGYFREQRYGFSTQTLGAFIGEQLTGLLVTLILGAILVILMFGVIRKAPKAWWIWGAVVMLAFIGFVMFIGPVLIQPLFNKYERLEDGELRDQILSLSEANGVEADDVWVFDASRQHNRISANVSGLFGTQRIALNDNLVKNCTLPEIRSVMAHEIGHYVLNHILKIFMFIFILIVFGFKLIELSFDLIVARFKKRFGGIGDPGDVAGLPLLILLITTYFFIMTPVVNSFIRMQEKEADLFALNAARAPDAEAEVDLKVGEYRKTDPSPLEEIIFFDHPSTVSRIRMAMQWKSENLKK